MISAVIPTLNAATTLSACLASVSAADEIVVADGGSTDGSLAIAEGSGAAVTVCSRGRGAQLDAGALAATGDWLLFLHADTVLAPGWREAADLHIASRPGEAAFFRFRLDSGDRRARLIEAGVALRVALLRLPYGDQGLLVSRSLYRAVGGFRPLPLMEDVDIVRRIGRARLRPLPVDAVTSARRWRQDGWARRSARNLLCLGLYAAGVSPTRIAALYD